MIDPPLDPWPLLLQPAQRHATGLLADLYLPGDQSLEPACPPASVLGIDAFFDEWLSAPYPRQRHDHALILPLIDSVAMTPRQVGAISSRESHAEAAARFRVLAIAAYYTSPAGIAAIGFVGNVALDRFDGVPADVVRILEERYRQMHRDRVR